MDGATPPVLRRPVLDELERAVDAEGLADLLETYLDDTPRLMEEIRGAIDASDAQVVFRSAHSLKGSSAIFGADGMAGLCGQLEKAAREGLLDGASESLALIDREYQRLRLAIGGELGRLRGEAGPRP